MSDPFATTRVGQSLLNAELTNGLAAKDAELHALKMAQVYAGNSGSTSDLKKKVSALEAERNRVAASLKMRDAALLQSDMALTQTEAALAEARAEIAKRDAAIAERDSLVIEWMHSNEAFKRLARQFGKKLGVSDPERIDLVNQEILNAAEEDPRFEKTELKARSEARLKTKT